MNAAFDTIPLTILDRAECFRSLHATAPNPREVAHALAARMDVSLRSVQHDLQIGMCLAVDVRDALRATPFANRKRELLALARVRPAVQRRVIAELLSKRAPSVRVALDSLTTS
jgi:hypothetical protein